MTSDIEENAEEPPERHAHRRNRAGLDDEEERPSVEESPERRERLAEVHVLSAGTRHHRRELAVGKSRRQREGAGNDPGHQQPPGTSDLPRNVGGDDEDARTNHRTGDNHRRIEQTQALNKALRR